MENLKSSDKQLVILLVTMTSYIVVPYSIHTSLSLMGKVYL